jgi:hypothetical protein
MGHYCRICGRERPNEQFSGKSHKIHVCKSSDNGAPRHDRRQHSLICVEIARLNHERET